jgi:hypothetical protein
LHPVAKDFKATHIGHGAKAQPLLARRRTPTAPRFSPEPDLVAAVVPPIPTRGGKPLKNNGLWPIAGGQIA